MTGRAFRSLVFAPICLALLSCSSGEGDGDTGSGGAGGSVALQECGSSLDRRVLAGQGEGDDFVPFQEGDPLVLEFASQAGLAAGLTIQITGVDAQELTSVELDLVTEGASIGTTTVSARVLQCQGDEYGRLAASIPIDVTEHPMVSSVAQLDGAPATLTVSLSGASGSILEQSFEVMLDP